jgi:hypothetical protein
MVGIPGEKNTSPGVGWGRLTLKCHVFATLHLPKRRTSMFVFLDHRSSNFLFASPIILKNLYPFARI